MTGRARRPRDKRVARLHPSPAAFALDGSIIASAALLDGAGDPSSAVREASKLGGRVFVGIQLRAGEATELQRWLDDAAYERLAFILGARLRRKGRSADRKDRRRDP